MSKEHLSCCSRISMKTRKAQDINIFLSLSFSNFAMSTRTTRIRSISMHFITIQQRFTIKTHLSQLMFLLIFILNIINVNSVCNDNHYDSFDFNDCLVAFIQFSQNKSIRYFVKQQLCSESSCHKLRAEWNQNEILITRF